MNLARLMENLKIIKKILANRFIITSIFMATCLFVLGMTTLSLNTFEIKADGTEKTIRTYDTNLNNVLKNNGFDVDVKDRITYSEQKSGHFDVTIERGFIVNLFADGEMMSTTMYGGTVGDVLDKFDITLKSTDKVNYSTDEALTANMNITVNRVAYKTITDEYKVPYKTELVPLSYSYSGKKSNTARSGKEGVRTVTKELKIVDGEVVETKIVQDKITKKPVNAVVYSDASNLLNKGKGKPETYKRALEVTATAYTGAECSGNTATGKKPRVGYVAVDPRVIRLGTKLYIESLDGSYVYGYAEAQDTGGAIKGKKIDIYLPSIPDCRQFGRKKMRVYVLS